jgi:hypothetical protein
MVLTIVTMKSTIFWYVMPCSLVDTHRCFTLHAACFFLAACLACYSTLKVETVHSSEMPVNLYEVLLESSRTRTKRYADLTYSILAAISFKIVSWGTYTKLNSVALVRKRTIPTERLLLSAK